jgi:hypothetical protein
MTSLTDLPRDCLRAILLELSDLASHVHLAQVSKAFWALHDEMDWKGAFDCARRSLRLIALQPSPMPLPTTV